MAEIKDSQLIRDALGSPVPQYWDETSQMYIARTVDGSFADVDFSKVRLLRDKLGSPIPQLWDTTTARFVPGNGGGNGDVTIESVPGLRSELDQTTAQLAEKAQKSETISTGKPAIGYAGVIRRDATAWSYIEDAVHEKINMIGVEETANNEIKITFTDALKVGSMIVTPDETLSAYGVICGASVGDYQTLIKSYAPFVGYISNNGTVVNTNPLFAGTATSIVSVDKTKMTVSYDGAGNGLDKTLVSAVNDNSGPYTGVDYHTARTGAGTVEIRAYMPLYANVYYDGAAWQVATSCKANIVASWDSATNELVITHDSMPTGAGYNQFQYPVMHVREPASGNYISGKVTTTNQTQIRVKFRDATNAVITAPSADMRVYIGRPNFKVPHEIPPGARLYFDFGYSIVRPSKMNLPFSNLWILGIHNK